MSKVFFGCSMRGGYSNVTRDELEKTPQIIEELGFDIASKHQTQKDWKEVEDKMGNSIIHDRNYNWLLDSDFGIFEISNPSLGVGGEISDMLHLGKPVLVLFKKGLDDSISAYILGKKGSELVKGKLEFRAYNNPQDIKKIISEFAKENLIN